MTDTDDARPDAGPFPPGLPTPIDDPSAWYGPAMAARTDWIETLTADELGELAAASQPAGSMLIEQTNDERNQTTAPTARPPLH